MRRLVFMPDYTADPLWENDGGQMVDLDSLPLSADLRERIRAWATRWEELADKAIFDEALADDQAAWAPIREEQHALWLALREELDGHCEVGLEVPSPDRKLRAHVIWSPGGRAEPAGWFQER